MDESLLHNTKVNVLKNEIEIIKETITDNMDKILIRDHSIDDVLDQTEILNDRSLNFSNVSKSLKRKIIWREIKTYGCIILCIIFIILIILIAFCGGFKFDKC